MDNIKKNFGFGCMRLPMNGENIDTAETCRMVDAFLDAGFNYFEPLSARKLRADGQADGKLF